MYGFGDEPDPAPDTVNVMEELVNDYITEMVLLFLKNFLEIIYYY
jgi:transcription initiation factor TFIID subunit 13